MFDTFLQVFAGCSRLGQTAALQCIRLWELQRPGGDGSGEAWQSGGDGNFSNSSGLDSASRRVNNPSNMEYYFGTYSVFSIVLKMNFGVSVFIAILDLGMVKPGIAYVVC